MERVNRIKEHPLYKEAMERIEAAEADRPYCGHGFCHQMDTARIAYILYLEGAREKGAPDDAVKELLYAQAMLHDIGRYASGNEAGHEEAGAALAARILPDCGFTREETDRIARAIRNHRKDKASLLYRADKLSRNCFSCRAAETCYWSQEKRNREITC